MLPEFEIEHYYDAYSQEAEIDLSSSDCETMSTEELLALQGLDTGALNTMTLEYTSTLGSLELRQLIASRYDDLGADNVLLFNSSGEAIYAIFTTLVDRNDHVIAHVPAYQSLYQVARQQTQQLSFWHAREANDWQPDIHDLKRLLRPNTKYVVINSPNNPTGHVFSQAFASELNSLAEQHGFVLISDELFRDLEFEPSLASSSMCDLSDTALSISGLAKSYGLPGLRLGWLATKNMNTYQKILRMKRYLSRCVATPSEFLATIALKSHAQIMARSHSILRQNLSLLDAFFGDYPDVFSVVPPQAGNTVFPHLLGDEDIDHFCCRIRSRSGLFLLPGHVFAPHYRNFRLGFAHADMSKALVQLRMALDDDS